ncbi:hypothetical protein [Nonomuraea sp. NPDC050786]|uniref:hypothetical protein n=1 Tax=Nonomuraea sp. NPDC050786 TaxID=3154840 RepID=UPI0033E10F6F
MKGYMQALTTVPSLDEGAALARSITSQRLAAGVQQGFLRDEQEWQLVIKTTLLYLPRLRSA